MGTYAFLLGIYPGEELMSHRTYTHSDLVDIMRLSIFIHTNKKEFQFCIFSNTDSLIYYF